MTNLSNTFITIYTCSYPTDAAVIKGRLIAEGIECFLQDELTIGANPLYSNAVGGIKLQVKIEDFEKAKAILMDNETIQDGPNSKVEFEEQYTFSEKVRCPNCGSQEVSKPRLSSSSIAISILLLGFPLPWMVKTIHCFDCGGDFDVKKKLNA